MSCFRNRHQRTLTSSRGPSEFMRVDLLVEGPTDEAAAKRLLLHHSLEPGTTFGKHGASYIMGKASAFISRSSMNGAPLLLMLDLMDSSVTCARDFQSSLHSSIPSGCLVRAVVRELESRCLADVRGISAFLGVSAARIPRDPEELSDPKRALVDVARRSRLRHRLAAIVPGEGHAAAVGVGYTGEIIDFLTNVWDPERARVRAPSLERCMRRLAQLAS